MRKYFLYLFGVFVVIFVSLSLMDVSSGEEEVIEDTKSVISISRTAKAFQLGAFLDYDKALNLANLNESIVIKSNDYYYVYKAVLTSSSNINRMSKYLDNSGISYYVKDIDISENFSSQENSLEESMIETSSDVAFLTLNKKILEMYEETYEN